MQCLCVTTGYSSKYTIWDSSWSMIRNAVSGLGAIGIISFSRDPDQRGLSKQVGCSETGLSA
jgi:hypothetical protein